MPIKNHNLIWNVTLRSALVVTFAISMPASAQEGYVGVSVGQIRIDNEGQDFNPLQSRVKYGLSFLAKSRDDYLEDSQFGYIFEYGLDTYKAERATIWGLPGSTQTINTSVSGYYLHFTPTLFYDFTKGSSTDWSFKTGIGLGVSYFTVNGTMIFNKPFVAVRQVNDGSLGFSKEILFRLENKHVVIQLKETMPTGKIQGVDMQLQMPLLTVAYKFEF